MDVFLTRLRDSHNCQLCDTTINSAAQAKVAKQNSSRFSKSYARFSVRQAYLVTSAARGNTSLESAVSLTKTLRLDMQALGQRLANAAASEELLRKGAKSPRDRSRNDAEIKLIVRDIKRLLTRIEDAVPLMNLAITTSGARLSTNLPATVSPSRLLQASTFLTAGDTQYWMSPTQAIQIGPTFTLSIYMLFAGHVRPQDEEGIRETTWKEVIHKARVKLRRVPLDLTSNTLAPTWRAKLPAEARIDEYHYQMLIIEDLDDGRVHSYDEDEPKPEPYEGIPLAGMREILPIHQISKIFYADTSKVLNINTEGEVNNPVLLLKRDINAIPPRRMLEREEADSFYVQEEQDEEETDEIQAQLDAQLNGTNAKDSLNQSYNEKSIPEHWRFPKDLDPEWIAFEVYNEDESSDTESEADAPDREHSIDPQMMAKLSLDAEDDRSKQTTPTSSHPAATTTVSNPLFNNIRTSLSLLETLLRLMSLQQFQQQSHLSISDELLNFFLEESSTTGAGGDEQHRQRLRADARRRVGWDPYDESPVKRRGEDYQYGWASDGPPASYSREGSDYPYTPTDRYPGYHLRSRENTPETPLQSRRAGSIKPDARRQSAMRDSSVLADEASSRGSPLSRRSTSVEDTGPRPMDNPSRTNGEALRRTANEGNNQSNCTRIDNR
ncbi:RanGTP-binding protein [Aspergillus fumigatus A1163]|uniref:RanGTP-binding protein n=1 Tax=Aspergillus fumigatus (strain CBS 144.89 / FGSC A1163 / CEA10) TaxID=451804 RepID=B0XV68_ASPFC|nr:RanGTP-binding protein [Aspergillus fumigatus A1163]